MFSSIRMLVEGDRAAAVEHSQRAIALIAHGPEKPFYQARQLAYLTEGDQAIVVLARAVDEGFFCYPALVRDPWLDSLRTTAEFKRILKRAFERHSQAVRKFVEAGGQQLLGVRTALPRNG